MDWSLKPLLAGLAAASLAGGASAQANDGPRIPSDVAETARALGEAGLEDRRAYELTGDLTTLIGPRLAGTEAEARARDWAVAELEGLGFDRVYVEPFELDLWTRGEDLQETIAITAPAPQALIGASLGGAAGTPEGGIEAEIAFFESFDDLIAAPQDGLEGKIVFVNDRMVQGPSGEGYGRANRKRRTAWIEAEDRGAVGVVIRSVGTSTHRFPHTGMMAFPDGRRPTIPAMAVSNADADQIERLIERGETVRLRLETDAGWRGSAMSGNVIAEITGRARPEEVVVIGAHLDSWDLSPGALVDGAGVGIVTAAAKLIADLPERPRRTIRVVLFGAEEVGLVGARAYAANRREAGEIADHVIGSESDYGAGRVWRLNSQVSEEALPTIRAMADEMAFLGILPGLTRTGGGPDMIPLQALGVPMARLQQYGPDFFDYHHTPDDTFDKIDPEAMAQNVAAWAMFAYFAAELEVDFRAPEHSPETAE